MLPRRHLLDDPLSDPRDGLFGHRGAVDLGQMGGDLPVGEPLGRQRTHQRIDTDQAPATLRHDLRLERRVAIPGHLELHRPHLGDHRLGACAVARVARQVTGRVVRLVAEMLGQLGLQRRLQHRLGQPGQQPAGPHQAHPLGVSPGHQLGRQLLQRARARRVLLHINSVSHYLSFPARPSTQPCHKIVTPL